MNCAAAHKDCNSIHGARKREKSWRSQFMTATPSNHSKKRGLTMKENFLVDLSKQFAVDIVNLCTDIKENRKSNVLLNQVLRSGTSIGANIHEANYAASKADFINKFQIALKECYETDYWLGLFKDTHMITEEEYKDMFAKCSKIRKLLIASITTAKENS